MRMKLGLTAALMVLAATTVWAQKVETQYDHGVDFSRYKTYAWTERKFETMQGAEGTHVIDQVLLEAVNKQLQAKGLTEAENAPDLHVTFYAGSHVKEAKAGVGYAPWDLVGYGMLNVWTSDVVPGSTPSTWVAVQGIVLFEISDSRNNAAIWSSLLTKKIKNPGRMPKDIDKAAAEIAKKAFQNSPPSPGGK